MLLTPELTPQVIPLIFLVITIISIFIKPKLWPISLTVTLVAGFVYHSIDVTGLGIIALLMFLSFHANKLSNKIIKNLTTILVFISCIALAAHLLPGFNNLEALSQVFKSPDSTPFTMFLNFDKPLIIFILLALYPKLLINNKPVTIFKIHNITQFSTLITLAFIIIFSLATLLSLIKYAPHLPSWWWLFALNNLLLTCVVEEVFFRGFVQQKLTKLLSPLSAILLTSFLFGLAHFAGGFNYVIVATLAGFLYGVVYLITGKVWHAVLVHFCLNMIHLSLFTYPLLNLE